MILILSLGWNCEIKNELRSLQKDKNKYSEILQTEHKFIQSLLSYPLDWLQSPNPQKVMNLIKYKYNGIIDKNKLKYTVTTNNYHIFYNEIYDLKFLHTFSKQNSSDISFNNWDDINYNNIYNNFQTRINRFFDNIYKAEKVYFLRLSSEKKNKELEKNIILSNLKEIFPNINYELIMFASVAEIKPSLKKIIDKHQFNINNL